MKTIHSILIVVLFATGFVACEYTFTEYYIEGYIKTADVTNITYNSAVCGGEVVIERKGKDVTATSIKRGVIYSTDIGALQNVSFDEKFGENHAEAGEGTFSFTLNNYFAATNGGIIRNTCYICGFNIPFDVIFRKVNLASDKTCCKYYGC